MKRAIVLGALLGTLACNDLIVAPTVESDAEAIYTELWRTFEARYAPFGQRGVDWAAAFQRHLPAPDAGSDDLFSAATGLLAELDDGHVTLVAPGKPVFVAQRSFREDTHQRELDLGLVFRQMTGAPERSGAAQFGVLRGDIGYVHVARWEDEIPDLDRVLSALRGRRGVIVDLRHNPGGDFRNGFDLAAHFADRKHLAFVTFTKIGPGPDELGQRVEWSIEPTGSDPIDIPTVVLTNGYTNSAAERTLMAFAVLPHVTVVGSPSAGNHGEKVGGELSNGWRYSLVPQVVEFADGLSYEGAGFPPDLQVDNTAVEIAEGLDRQLEAALALLTGG